MKITSARNANSLGKRKELSPVDEITTGMSSAPAAMIAVSHRDAVNPSDRSGRRALDTDLRPMRGSFVRPNADQASAAFALSGAAVKGDPLTPV